MFYNLCVSPCILFGTLCKNFPQIFLVLVIICISPISPLYSQTPPYYHYTTTDGLSSSTVFQAMQDKDGFIWFATLNGVSRFDGKRFTTYRVEDGLNSNVITSLLEGEKNEIYLGNYEKGINIFKNGRIGNYFSEIHGQNYSISYLTRYQEKIYTVQVGINVISEKPTGIPYSYAIPRHVIINRLAIHRGESDNNLLALTSQGLFSINNNTLTKLNINGLEDTVIYCFAARSDGSYFIGSQGMICRIKNNSVIKRYILNEDDEVNQILIDRDNNIWFAIRSKGAFLIPDGSDEIIDIGSKMGLRNTQVNSFLEDREDNIWISTFGKGVYCLNNPYLRNFSEKDGLDNNNVQSIVKEKSGKIIIGTFNGINIFENGVFNHLKGKSGKALTSDVFGIKIFNDSIYVPCSQQSSETINASCKGLNFSFMSIRSFYKTSDGLYMFGGWFNTIDVEKSSIKTKEYTRIHIFGDSIYSNRVYDIIEDSKKNIWAGTGLGLCKLSFLTGKTGKEAWQKSFFQDNPILSSRINFIYEDNKYNLWFAGVKGVAYYNIKDNSFKNFTDISGYDLSGSTSIASDKKNRIWIGTMSGLYLWESIPSGYDGISVKYLNSKTGLPSDEVLSLYYDDDKNLLYVGTSSGLSSVDIDMIDNYQYPQLNVKIIKIKAGDSVYTDFNNLTFEPEQNDVSIDLSALSFSSPGTVKYKYKLNDKWTETENNYLNFSSLQYGTYQLQVLAKTQNSDWGKPYFLSFEVKPGFTETIWYKIGVTFILAAVFFYVITWRMKRKTRKISEQLELTERINDLKHQALSAMMNPHFIFNSLNSVQYLVNCQKYEQANEYIAMMAKLMRKNLDTAGNGFILLTEEINRLKLYLDLEKLRFQESFSYEIIAGSDVDTESLMIPNMIIQPFVENSLWHGIINSGKKGILTVSFTFEDVEIDSILSRSLIIKVSDNGIGILEAKKNKKEDHISKGIYIIEERLRLLSAKMHLPKPIMFEDLSTHDNNSHGTEVIISLPPPLYKNIEVEN